MSDYGADENPDLNIASDLTETGAAMPGPKTNVMQWTYDDDIIVQKYARRRDKSNLHVKFQL